jgi:hypothetical protein
MSQAGQPKLAASTNSGASPAARSAVTPSSAASPAARSAVTPSSAASPAARPVVTPSSAASLAARPATTPRNSAIGGPHAQALARVGGPAISRTTHSGAIDGTQLHHK